MFRTFFVLFIVFSIAGCRQQSQLRLSEPNSKTMARLEMYMPELMRKNGISGVGVAIVRNNEISLLPNFGIADVQTNTRVDSNTIFEVASLGKPVFAYLAISLSQSGLYDLDVPLVRYLPSLFSNPDPRLSRITARMVLSHSSGLPNLGITSQEELSFNPGSSYRYSGVGFNKLQQVLEVLTGKPLNQLATEIIFDPFGMTSTSYIWNEKFKSRLAQGYKDNGAQIDQKRKPETGNASWSLHSTTADFARFVIRSLRKDDLVAKAMITPQISVSDEIAWGLGWSLQSTKPNRSIWHWGSNPGYRAYVVGYPEESIAVVVLSNSENMFNLIEDVVQMTIGGELPSYHWF